MKLKDCNVNVAAKDVQVEDLSVQLALLMQPPAPTHVKEELGDADDGGEAHETHDDSGDHANTNTKPRVLVPKKVLTRRDSHTNL